jgi:hypothetical protein
VRPRLRQLLAVPRAGCTSRGSASGDHELSARNWRRGEPSVRVRRLCSLSSASPRVNRGGPRCVVGALATGGDRKDQAKQNHRPLHKVQGPVRFARTSTSAERSEARGGDVEQSAMYRVASPLVMARLTSRVDSQRSNCIVVGTRASSHYLLLCRGVVPHETTIDSAVNCSGSAPLRLRQSLIWAPPEGAAAAATATSLSARARLLPRPRSGQLPSE